MTTIYRDYGTLGGAGFSGASNSIHYSQVYLATHDGEKRLSYMNRSFISFTFGGKHIEDFNLIATFNEDGFDKNGYAEFNDITSENDVVDGLMYWNTKINSNNLSLELATDGMTLKLLDLFLAWFSPGKARELVLSEHPNRAIYARIATPPQLLLLPFEEPTEVKLGNQIYNTSTTLYKGTITLEFVMDDPFWYSLINIFGEAGIENGVPVYYDKWTDANGEKVDVFTSKDAMKIVLEDGIPFSNMIVSTMQFGSSIVADMNTKNGAVIAPDDLPNYVLDDPVEDYAAWNSRIAKMEDSIYICGAVISGAYITTTNEQTISLNVGDELYFYYCGTAKSYPTLSFTLTPLLTNHYISNIRNKFTGIEPYYSTITLESINKVDFKFTTPGVYTAYNLAIYILSHILLDDTWEAVRTRIREQVKHYYVRAWANMVINVAIEEEQEPSSATNLCDYMEFFLRDTSNGNNFLPVTFRFDGKTGEALGHFQYRTINMNHALPLKNNGVYAWDSFGTIAEVDELIGDMIKSPYLVLTDRNYPNEEGNIIQWSKNQPENSYKLTHDIEGGITKVSLNYKNMYW